MIFNNVLAPEGDELDTDEFASFPGEAWFYYETSGYDGRGYMIYTDGHKWDYELLGHCSCNGPLENFDPVDVRYVSIKDLLEHCTEELQKDLHSIVEFIKK